MRSFYKTLISHPWISSTVTLTILVQLFESLLLQRRYELFTAGAFLQPYSVSTVYDYVRFFSASFWLDFALYGAVAILCFFVAAALRKSHLIAAYHYFATLLGLTLGILVAKFKVLAYFSDTINFTIAKNLAGGSLMSAMRYVAEESMLIILAFAGFLFVYWVCHLYLKRYVAKRVLSEFSTEPFLLRHIASFVILGLAVTAACLAYASNDANLRYGLSKKNSYYAMTGLFNWITDIDSDGYGYFSYPPDPDPSNAEIFPSAVDIPNNGIDEDGLFGDYTPANSADPPIKQTSVSTVSDGYPNIVFIVLESGRADLVGKSANGHEVAPVINEIARNGSVFSSAYSHTGYTTSSLTILFNGDFSENRTDGGLFDSLVQRGYDISVFSGQAESFGGISEKTRMKENATTFFDATVALDDRVYANTDLGSLRLSEERVVAEFKNKFDEQRLKKKNFIYFNLQAAHFPYDHPKMSRLILDNPIPRGEISIENQQWVELSYWNAIANADRAVGDIVAHLKLGNVYDRTLIIITGDHGESLFDDGLLGHGHQINDIQTHIPFVINQPGIGWSHPVGQQDMKDIVLCFIDYGCKPLEVLQHKAADNRGVFQYIGSLSSPRHIASVDNNGERLVLDMAERTLLAGAGGRWMPLESISTDERMNSKVLRLVFEWERLNWAAHAATGDAKLTEPVH